MGGTNSYCTVGGTEANAVCYVGLWVTNMKDWHEKHEFRDALESMMEMVEPDAMSCIACGSSGAR